MAAAGCAIRCGFRGDVINGLTASAVTARAIGRPAIQRLEQLRGLQWNDFVNGDDGTARSG